MPVDRRRDKPCAYDTVARRQATEVGTHYDAAVASYRAPEPLACEPRRRTTRRPRERNVHRLPARARCTRHDGRTLPQRGIRDLPSLRIVDPPAERDIGLATMPGRYVSLAEREFARFLSPEETIRELFAP